MTVLNLKYQVKMGADLFYYPIGYTVASIALNQLFKRLSGGVFNPALALAQICWQNLTYYYEIGSDSPYWTPDYAVCYILAPMFGAYLGGNLFNFQKRILRNYQATDIPEEDEATAQATRKAMYELNLKEQFNIFAA